MRLQGEADLVGLDSFPTLVASIGPLCGRPSGLPPSAVMGRKLGIQDVVVVDRTRSFSASVAQYRSR